MTNQGGHRAGPHSVPFGILARTFARESLEGTLDAVRESGFATIQLNLSIAGLATLPDRFEDGQIERIAGALKSRGIAVAALSGTFNMIDPDVGKRREFLRRLDVLAGACRALGAPLITLCTGTRDPVDMWRSHPDNDHPSAWNDLVASMREAVAIADRHDVLVAFEPEIGNVVDCATKTRALLDEIGSPRLKVVLDCANLLRPDNMAVMAGTIDEAFDHLGPDIALIHAKEIAADGSVGGVEPGKGVLDFARIFRRYLDAGSSPPIVLHGLDEATVAPAITHLTRRLAVAESSRVFDHDGIAFRYLDRGGGLPFVFQHGLSGDSAKMFDLIGDDPNFRFVSFDARYHGHSRPLGPPEAIGFDRSADDLRALLDHLGIEKAVIGGLSMGAGIALNFAIRYPERLLAMVLSRPAWLDSPLPANVAIFPEIAALIRDHGRAGREVFANSGTYAKAMAESSDSAATLLGMFDDPTAAETVERFERIPKDCPSPDRSAWGRIRVPSLVLGNHRDTIHPFAMAQALAETIPGAELRVLTPKCEDVPAHERDFGRFVREFLGRHLAERFPPTIP